MSSQELQEEELEVLHSIYEGDDCFKEIDTTTFQYKYGENGDHRSFNLELLWGDNYPTEPPTVNVDTFYNKHILPEVKEKIHTHVKEQINELLDMAMTYTIFESVRENLETIISDQPETAPIVVVDDKSSNGGAQEGKKKEKKEQLSKNQKKKLYDKVNSRGEMPRGWDWVDVVKHLCQTGGQPSTEKGGANS
ncbi:hypothetical protein ScPMuIL_006213 [Solemya velum]